MVIFATVFGVGFVILLLSLVLGGDADADIDTDADIGDSFNGPSIFSIKMLALIMVGFGSVGFGVRTTTDWSMFQASMAGIGGAAGVGFIGWLILKMFYSSQASSTITEHDLVGATGHIIDSISSDSYGQVSFTVRGREITYLARSDNNQPIAKQTPVKIISKNGNIVTVAALLQDSQQ